MTNVSLQMQNIGAFIPARDLNHEELNDSGSLNGTIINVIIIKRNIFLKNEI